MPLRYQSQRESRDFFISHVPLVIGLVFVAPWWHLLARVPGWRHEHALARNTPSKWAFNTALGCWETAAAILVLQMLVPQPQPNALLWSAILAAVLVSEVTSVLVLQVLLSPRGRAVHVAGDRSGPRSQA